MRNKIYQQTKWLRFYIVAKKRKTVVIHVFNTSDQFLGSIGWHGPWRQYTYTADPGTEIRFNNGCLTDIADVLTRLNSRQDNWEQFFANGDQDAKSL